MTYAPGTEDLTVSQADSAQRVRAPHEALTVEPEPAALKSAGGPVLLVDDLSDTGRTPAVAARLLRRAGAEGCVP